MYKKNLLSLLFCCICASQPIRCMDFGETIFSLYAERSTTQKTDNLNAWMVWKTSKEYVITYHRNDTFYELGIEPMRGDIGIGSFKTTINEENVILTKTSCSHVKIIEYNALHDIACGINLITGRYTIYHYRIFKNEKHKNIRLLIQPIVELPELDKYWNGKRMFGFNANKDGTMVAIVIKGGTIAKIVPKKIPLKDLLSFNNLHDILFKYL